MITSIFFPFPSLRMIQELTKRTPCFLPVELFLPQRPLRTTWSTTRTFGRSKNPKWGGRNEWDPPWSNRLTFATVVGAFRVWAGTSTAVGFLYTDWLLLREKTFFCVNCNLFSKHSLCKQHYDVIYKPYRNPVILWIKKTIFFFFYNSWDLQLYWQQFHSNKLTVKVQVNNVANAPCYISATMGLHPSALELIV